MEQMVKREDDYQNQSGKLIAEPMSEATKIEQTRVAAEVAMQAELAKRYPRNMTQVFQRIEETFALSPELVAKSKFSFKRGTQNVQGFTIQFARAIAECVGNITYSFKELSRNDSQSEMFVYAWDLETNTMQSRSFIVKHVRDKTVNFKNVPTDLTTQRDIYENNANNAAKRIRECILGVLPTAARMKGQSIVESLKKEKYPVERMEEFIRNIVEKFKTLGVSRQQLIKERDNRPCEMWMRSDLSVLNEHYEDIQNEVQTIHDIFDIQQKTVELVSKKDKKDNVHNFKKPFEEDDNPPKKQTQTKLNNEQIVGKTANNFVDKLKRHFENPDYIETFEQLAKDNHYSNNRIKAIIKDNDQIGAERAVEAVDTAIQQ